MVFNWFPWFFKVVLWFSWFLVGFHGFSKVVLWVFIFFMLDSMVYQRSFMEGVWQEVLIRDFTREVDGRKS